MTTEEIIEGNKLIADFMGFQKCNCIRNENGRYYDYYLSDKFELIEEVEIWIESEHGFGLENQDMCFIEELKFHSSYEWLMLAVEKIELLLFPNDVFYNINILSGCEVYIISSDMNEFGPYSEPTKKLTIFKGVVEFIKWYNEQNK